MPGISDTMPNRAVYLSQYQRGKAKYMIFNVTSTMRRAYFFSDANCTLQGLVGQYDLTGKQAGYQVAILQDFFWVTDDDGKPLYRTVAKYWP